MSDLALDNDIPTATANPGQVLDVDFTACPPQIIGEGLSQRIEHGMTCVTVLKAGMGGDVACYEALVSTETALNSVPLEIGMQVAKWGNKLSEKRAALIFDGLAAYGRYRP